MTSTSIIGALEVPISMTETAVPKLIYQDQKEARGALSTVFLPTTAKDSYPRGRIEVVSANQLSKAGVRHVRVNLKYYESTGMVTTDVNGKHSFAPSSVKENVLTVNVSMSFNNKAVATDTEFQSRAKAALLDGGQGVVNALRTSFDDILIGGN